MKVKKNKILSLNFHYSALWPHTARTAYLEKSLLRQKHLKEHAGPLGGSVG